ncbi:cell surface glycoprotein [Halorubrum lipolyticum DSM 21995]|uniref:Cell surface glycoprotein n=1 Tax=Halorubrum lipolyticum DSM 21995 TaxID=1227482 RepID=M0NMK9_9EURY|nr:cell surface glycoprotein [Halorubrum lipolyticum DSM 21995]
MGVPGVADADGDFTITVENGEIDVPNRTTEIAGQEFTVTSVAPIDPGEAIEAQISTSTDDPYDVFLYNSDGLPDGRELGVSGETSTTFETTDLDPGTYSVVVSTDQFETIQPVVIAAYDTTLSAPAEITEGETASIDIETSEHDDADAPAIERVDAVIANDSTRTRIEATEAGDGEYVADVSAAYEPGEYRLYGVVYEDEETANGELDIISVSDRHTVTVTEGETTDGEGENGTDGTDGGGAPTTGDGSDDGSEDPTDNTTNDTGETGSETTENGTDSGTDDGTDSTAENDTDSTTENGTDSTTENETDGQAIQPNDSESVSESSGSVPLNGVQIIVATLLSIALVVRVRRRRVK